MFPSAGDETQVALAIVQTSSRDCGVYGCTITNEYGTDTTDFLLSVDSMYTSVSVQSLKFDLFQHVISYIFISLIFHSVD